MDPVLELEDEPELGKEVWGERRSRRRAEQLDTATNRQRASCKFNHVKSKALNREHDNLREKEILNTTYAGCFVHDDWFSKLLDNSLKFDCASRYLCHTLK